MGFRTKVKGRYVVTESLTGETLLDMETQDLEILIDGNFDSCRHKPTKFRGV